MYLLGEFIGYIGQARVVGYAGYGVYPLSIRRDMPKPSAVRKNSAYIVRKSVYYGRLRLPRAYIVYHLRCIPISWQIISRMAYVVEEDVNAKARRIQSSADASRYRGKIHPASSGYFRFAVPRCA